MRKFLLSAIALLMTISTMAVGLGNGSSKVNAIDFDWINGHEHEGTLWYRVDLFEIGGMVDSTLSLSLKNLSDASAKVTVDVSATITISIPGFSYSEETTVTGVEYTIAAEENKLWSQNIRELLELNIRYLYLELNTTEKIALSAEYEESVNAKPVEVASCENSQLLDWNSTIKQSGLETKWYEIDLATIKQNGEHLQLTFTNKTDKVVVVMGEILHTCGSDKAIPYVCPVPAGSSVSQVINYNLFALVPHPKHFYVSATAIPTTATSILDLKDVRSKEDIMAFVPKDLDAIKAAEVELTAKTISASANPTDCNQAVTINRGVKYEQQAGTTKWYRVTDELLNKVSLFPDVAFINNGKKAANVTIAATVSCEYSTFGMSTITLPTWADFTMFPSNLIGKLLDKSLNQDVTEMYIQVTTDQPIAFGIDIDYGFGLGCDAATAFDWTNGHTQEAKSAQWYEFDVNDVKKNHNVKLTFTNNSNGIAWIATLLSLECPFDNALPLAFPVPAGASVDKVIDYNYFASTKLERLYVAIVTDENISIKAQTIEATPSVSDMTACQNAVVLKQGVMYDKPAGSSWYEVNSGLFADMDNLPEFRLATVNGATALTWGTTVDCGHKIPSTATINLPGNVNIGFRFPSFVFDVLKKLVNEDLNKVYVEMTTDKAIRFGIAVDGNNDCSNAPILDFSKPISLDFYANKEVWYKVDMNALKELEDKNLEFVMYADNANVEFEIKVSPTCPVVLSAYVEKGMSIEDSLTAIIPTEKVISFYDDLLATLDSKLSDKLVDAIAGNHIYNVRIRTNVDVTIKTDSVTPPVYVPGCEDAIELDWSKTIDLSTLSTGWYKFDISNLHMSSKNFTLSLNNNTGKQENLGFDFYKGCDIDENVMADMYIASRVMTFPIGVTTYTVPSNLIGLASGVDVLYVYLTRNAKQPCEEAIMFDWNKGTYQEANKTQWYEFDITPVLEGEKQVKLTFTNRSNENAWVIAELALNCPYTKSIPIIVPVPANMSVDKWIDYSVFEASRLKHCYMGVTTREAAIELSASWEDARIVPSEGCLNATKVETDVLYEHAAGTHWYKFTKDLFDKEGYFSRVRVINRSAETLNITAGATVGCEYNIATRTSFKLPMRFDLAFAIPVWVIEQMQRFVDNDVTEFYVELTTDQPMAFSIGQDACESAIPFDWSTGHTQEALTTQWYDVNIAPVLANEQQIKLTLTNHSNQTAWVATLVSLDCPFKVAMPLMLPIPAGTSIDKWIDYSYFASTKLDRIYVGVTTDSKISITAEAQSAVVTPTADCANATKLETGVKYVHEGGTAWYKVDGSLFADMSRLPKFSFVTVSGEKTSVTFGATVGCEYNIATRGTISVPGDVEVLFRMPRAIFKVVKEFINDDVNAYYIEITTDKVVEFGIDMTNEEDVDVCLEAVDLVVSDSMSINLVADTDMWYKLNLSQIHGLNKDLAVTVNNPSAAKANIEIEISPTCPVVASVLKNISVPAELNVVTVYTAEQIAQLVEKYPNITYYVRVRASEDLLVEVEEYIPAAGCEEAEEYIWDSDIQLNADEEKWYKLAIVDMRDKTCDITLTANNASVDTVKATIDLYEDCPAENHIVTMKDLAIAPNTIMNKTVSSTELPMDVDTIYLHVKSTGEVTVNVVFDCEIAPIPPVEEFAYDTIYSYDCVDEQMVWNDTVIVNVSETLDSIYVHTNVINPLIAPIEMTDSILATISGATLELSQGVTPNMSASIVAIKDYYQTLDAEEISDVVSVAWEPIAKVDCEAIKHTVSLIVVDACGDTIATSHTFDVTPKPVGAIDTIICADEIPYVWNGELYTLTGVYTDTLVSAITGCDSIVTLDLTVLPDVVDSVTNVTISRWESYIWSVNGNVYTQVGSESVVIPNQLGCDSIIYTLNLIVKNVLDSVVTGFVCDGTEYVDPITNEKKIISSLIPSTSIWRDTIVGTVIDTIYNFEIIPIVAPVVISDSILATISNANPILVQGEKPQVDASIAAIKNYYQLEDTEAISDVLTITWSNADTILACDALTHTMVLTVEDNCGNELNSSFVFEVQTRSVVEVVTDTIICQGYSCVWNGETYSVAGQYKDTIKTVFGCDSIVYVLNLTISQPVLAELTATACGSYVWNGTTYKESGNYTYTTTGSNGCDSTTTLHLTINQSVTAEFTAVACDSYVWEGETLTVSGDYTRRLVTVNGCDSVVTLHLTILPAAVTENEVLTICESEFPYKWRGETLTAIGTYTVVEQYAATDCDSVIHVLDLQTYVMTLPTNIADPIAVCGEPVNVEDATSDIEVHIATTNLYAPNAVVNWYIYNNGDSTLLTNDLIKGGVDEIIIKYVITSDCGSLVSDAFTLTIEVIENDVDEDDVLAISKYDNRIFLLHLNDFIDRFGWSPSPDEVTWYRVVNEEGSGVLEDDIQVGKGHSYNELDGSIIAPGKYYALIIPNELVDPDDCDGQTIMRTVTLLSGEEAMSPQLISNVVRPNDNLKLVNLNSDETTKVCIYNTMGELIETYIVDKVSEFVFNAAHASGYYLIDVQTATDKTTLRYIVK